MEEVWKTEVKEGLVTTLENSFSIRLCRADPGDPNSAGAAVVRASGCFEPASDDLEIEWRVRQVEATELPIVPQELWDRVDVAEWSAWTDGHDRSIKSCLEGWDGDELWRQVAPELWLSVSSD